MSIKMAFRWYGESDNIPLEYIRQIPPIRSIVSAVYDTPVGQVWRRESLQKLKDECEKHKLVFDVVESIPVHEDIKLGKGKCDEYIRNYCANIKLCGQMGIKCITYNFMPIFDWTRTSVDKRAGDNSTSLVMYKEELSSLNPLTDDIRLPGWDSSYSKEEIVQLIEEYKELGEQGLWRNLKRFLDEVVPVAEMCGVRLALHPDDPPYSIFGLPRIIVDERALERVLGMVDSPSNCLCLCTGSLGCVSTNNVVKMIDKFATQNKIAFMHIRNVKIVGDGSFEETAHMSKCGSLDMYEIVRTLILRNYDGYVRADHGRMIWGERGKSGYGLYDRALGVSYLSGLFEGLEKELGYAKR